MHYIYRKFHIDLPALTKDYRDFVKQPVDLSKIYSSDYVLGLCLTYHVNYGLSYRQTASILKDIHEVSISYKTVENYCKSVSPTVQALLEFYPYDLSDTIAADETYIKILGKTAYIFFFFDAVKKIVTSYRVFDKRDSLSSIKAAFSTLSKYDKLPDSLKVITDGNPIYNVAVQYWCQNGLPFELFQVIGLTNLDETSNEYRSQKQIIDVINVNLTGTILCCQLMIKNMKKHNNGFIININSQLSNTYRAERSVYCASKWGVTGFSNSLQEEIANNGIKVTNLVIGTLNETMKINGIKYRRPIKYIDNVEIVNTIKFLLNTPKDIIIPEITVKSIYDYKHK